MASLEDVNKTVVEIRNDLNCQICQDHARHNNKKWYRCLNLHPICQRCKARKKCSCGQPISLEYCKQTEKLLSLKGLNFKCVNASRGCQEILARNALEEHKSVCQYRLVPCPWIAMGEKCRAKVTCQNAIPHLDQHLKKKGFSVYVGEPKIKPGMSEFGMLGFDSTSHAYGFDIGDRTFLLTGKTEDKICYDWMYLLGSPEEAEQYTYSLKFHGKQSGAEIQFKGKVASIDETFDTLFNAGKCFAYPHKAFIAQVVEDMDYEMSVGIRNVDDENNESGSE